MAETVIITGANRGIGYETALALAYDPSRAIVLAGRDLDALSEAAEHIRSVTGNEQLTPMEIDLASLSSVRSFAAAVGQRDLPPLSTIICNAAISQPPAGSRSAEGYELTFAVNHLGHFLLVHLLLDSLQPPARILFVSSARHDAARSDGPMRPPRYVKAEWLAFPERDPAYGENGDVYATTKLCNVLTTYEFHRRLQESDISTPDRPITANAFDPGLVAGTGLGRTATGFTRLIWYRILPWISRVMGFGRSAKQAGEDLAYLATAPELSDVSGKYFSGREMTESSAESYDREKAADLWQTSVELCDLDAGETPLL